MDIHWETTFFYLNDDEYLTRTSFHASSIKANYIKHMFEKLSTLERLKLRRPDLYKDWNCPMCKNFLESFSHIWSCPQNMPKIRQLIYFSKQKLVSPVNKFIPEVSITMHDLSHNSSI